MGQDKALLPFLGQPLIARLVTRLAPIADEIIVTTNHPADYAFLNLPLYPDLIPERGALGGLYTAIASARNPFVAVVACDMPFASPQLLAFQRDVLEKESVDVVIPRDEDGFEPLHTLYRRETCLPAIKTAIDANLWKVISWFPHVKVREISVDEILPHDPQRLAFVNVNTPEEFRAAEQQARAFL
jgi:molybdopterin-guanine dinucleotide biosynthesis protein A